MNRKVKFLILLGSVLIIFFIYMVTYHDGYNYVALGDGISSGINSFGVENYSYSDYLKDELDKNNRLRFYTKDFSEKGYSINDLYDDIINNKVVFVDGEKMSIRKVLRESNLVTLAIGSNDFLKVFNYSINDEIIEKIEMDKTEYFKKIDTIVQDMDKLLKEIKKYVKGKIIVVGYYNPSIEDNSLDEIVKYANFMVEGITDDNGVDFLNMHNELKYKDYFSNPSDMHLNQEGYRKISTLLLKKLAN